MLRSEFKLAIILYSYGRVEVSLQVYDGVYMNIWFIIQAIVGLLNVTTIGLVLLNPAIIEWISPEASVLLLADNVKLSYSITLLQMIVISYLIHPFLKHKVMTVFLMLVALFGIVVAVFHLGVGLVLGLTASSAIKQSNRLSE